MDSEAQKPCRFCGGEGKYYYYTRAHNIECENCNNGTCLHETKAEAITAWNTRADASEAQAKTIEALREALDRIKAATGNEMRAGDKGYVSRYGIHGIASKALQETER